MKSHEAHDDNSVVHKKYVDSGKLNRLFICPIRDFKASEDYFYNGSNDLCRM